MRFHSVIICLTALICLFGFVGASVIEKRDACGNGVKVCGSGSVSCSGNTCRACQSGGKCCTIARPRDSSCNQATPCVNFDTCSTSSSGSSTTPATGSTGGSTTVRRCNSFEAFLKRYGYRVNCQ